MADALVLALLGDGCDQAQLRRHVWKSEAREDM